MCHYFVIAHRKNSFVEVSKNLAKYINNFDCEDNYVGRSSWLLECHNFFAALLIMLETV